MKKAWVIYQSKTGITKRFAGELGEFLTEKGLEVKVSSIQEFDPKGFVEVPDIVMLGCWTAGFMLMFQHPDKPWKDFAACLPDLGASKTALFTTYKIATGSMFKSMQKHLSGKSAEVSLELKSRNGKLSDSHRQQLDALVSR